MSPGRGPLPSDDELDDEIRFHLESRAKDLMAQGFTAEDAWAEARRRFGDVEGARTAMKREDEARHRAERRRALFAGLALDLRWAARQLRRSPLASGVVVATLALGIGAATALFSVVDHVIFRPLPYPDPGSLVALWSDVTERGGPDHEWLSYANFADVRDGLPGVEAGAVWGGWSPTLTHDGEAMAVPGAVVGAGMFSRVLGIAPALGRDFTAAEDRPEGPAAAILSHGLWQEVFGGDESAVGTTLTLNGSRFTVVGVMPEGFRAPFVPDARIWGPSRVDPVQAADARGGFSWRAVLRLQPGVESAQAASAARDLGARLAADHPASNTGMSYLLAPLADDLVREQRQGFFVLLAGILLVLLVASLNVASILTARASARRGELAVRMALGAGRGRLTRQLLTEASSLTLLGGGAGVVLSLWLTPLLVRLAPADTPRLDTVSVDLRVLAAALAITGLVGLLTGLLPALRLGRSGDGGPLVAGVRGAAGARDGLRLRRWLVGAQLACALVTAACSGLLLQSFGNLRTADLGYEPEGVLTFFLPLATERYSEPDARRAFIREVEARLSRLPGVEAVGMVESPPLAGFDGDASFVVDGREPPGPGVQQAAWIRPATPGYREAMGLRLRAGRFVGVEDGPDDPRVLVINETFAERHFAGVNPVGRHIRFGRDPESPRWQVVGVVADTRHFSVRDDRREAAWLSMDQLPQTFFFGVLRGAPDRDPVAYAGDVRRVVGELDPQLAPRRVEAMARQVSEAMAPERYLALLLSLFALLAVLLAMVGLYGVVSQAVSARLPELGVRMALGAEAGDIRRLVVSDGVRMLAGGLAAGLVASLVVRVSLRPLLFQVPAWDPTALAGAVGLLVAVCLTAAAVPAWRASRTDPSAVLRAE